jgi:hemerythrin superfamily protein
VLKGEQGKLVAAILRGLEPVPSFRLRAGQYILQVYLIRTSIASTALWPYAQNDRCTRELMMARKASGRTADAVALLKADHRQVSKWFGDFEKAKSSKAKGKLATAICRALTVHARIEEEIFYPAFLKATKDKDMHHEAEIEHLCAKQLIADIADSGPSDDYFDSKVHVLAEMIKHHVREEEQPGGMFAEAKQSNMNLRELGEELLERKQELMAH